jgi:hypothetical protein
MSGQFGPPPPPSSIPQGEAYMQTEQYAATFGQEAAIIQRQQAERAGLSAEEAAQRMAGEAAYAREQHRLQAQASGSRSQATVAASSGKVAQPQPTLEQIQAAYPGLRKSAVRQPQPVRPSMARPVQRLPDSRHPSDSIRYWYPWDLLAIGLIGVILAIALIVIIAYPSLTSYSSEGTVIANVILVLNILYWTAIFFGQPK